jgi:serine/threonine protein kinase
MSLCINPHCRQPNHPDNSASLTCQSCGSDLLLQGRYRVMRLISNQSGFGRVYEAYERNIPKILKVLKESYNHNDKVLELFRREVQVLSQLNHPGVPQVEPDGYFLYFPKESTEPLHCLVMEKIDGPNLKQWMVQQGNHPISEKQAMLWLTQLTDVLHLVHQHNYFHRDIKPENIMLRSSGQLVLVDFGAAREMTQTYLAQLGDSDITAVSSAGYTPPEQEQGQAVPQSDFYAMGRTLIYLLTAKMPNDPSVYDSRTNAFRWREDAPQISTALADFIDELIAPAAANRPQTTTAILERLAQVRAAQITKPPRPSESGSSQRQAWPATVLDPHHAASHAATAPEPSRRFLPPWLDQRPWLLAGLTGLVLAVPLAWYALNRDGAAPPENGNSLTTSAREDLTVTLTSMLSGHQSEIKDLMLLGDGNTLITASADRTIRIWDLDAGTLRQTLDQHTNVVKALAVTTDQSTLISTGDDRTIRFWSLPEGKPLGQIDNAHNVPINTLEVSNNNKLLVSADGDGSIKLWNLVDGNGSLNLPAMRQEGPFVVLKAESGVNDLLFTRDDNSLVSGSKSLQVWDVDALEKAAANALPQPTALIGHTSFINRLAISEDDQTLVSASVDKSVGLWDMTSKISKATLQKHANHVNTLWIKGQEVWSADRDKIILVWDLNTGTLVQKITGFDTDIWRLAIRPDGQIITVGGTEPYNIRVWQVNSSLVP